MTAIKGFAHLDASTGKLLSTEVPSSGAPTDATYVTLSTNASLSQERVLTGTSSQITLTDNGAGSTIVLSLPQNYDTAATPQLGRLGLGVAADATFLIKASGATSGIWSTSAGPAKATPNYRLDDGTQTGVVTFESANMIVGATTNTSLLFIQNNTTRITIANPGDFTHTQGAASSGNHPTHTINAGAHTSQTASADIQVLNVNGNVTAQWATGAHTTQRMALFQAQTIAYVGASTLTTGATVSISGGPILGANATFTTISSLQLEQYSAAATNASALIVNQPGLANAYGNSTILAGIRVPAATIAVGNTTNTTTNANSLRLEQITYTSTSNVRTFTNLATAYIAGPPNPSTNVTALTPIGLFIDNAAVTSGSPTLFQITGGAHTNLTLSTEAIDVNFNLARTVQFATGTLTTQRAFYIQAPTYGFVGASALPSSHTMSISGAPIQGTNATFTTINSALNIEAFTSAATVTGAGISVNMLGITNGRGNTNTLAGIIVVGSSPVLGNQTATTDDADTIRIENAAYTSTTNVRTITRAAGLYVAGPPTPGSNVTMTNAYGILIHNSASSSGKPTMFGIIAGAHTTLDASAEIIDVNINLNRNVQRNTGAVTTQRAFLIQAPSYNFVGASVITTGSTFNVSGAPGCQTNCSITNAFAAQIGGAVTLNSGAGIIYGAIDVPAHTVSYNGNTQVTSVGAAGVRIGQITLSAGLAMTQDSAASLYISNAPVGGGAGPLTLTAAYSIWVDAGLSRLDGGVAFGNAATDTTLSNYTQATFTPTVTLVGGAGNTVPVYSTNTGRYTRIGNRVFVDVYLTGDGGAEGAGTGVLSVALPIAASGSNPTSYFPIGFFANGTAEDPIWGQIAASASVVDFAYEDVLNNFTVVTGDLQNNTTRTIRLKFQYEV